MSIRELSSGELFDKLVKMMCQVVCVPCTYPRAYKPSNKNDHWYTSKSWTQKQEYAFHERGVKLLMKEAHLTRPWAEREMDMFILGYGWTRREE